MNIRSFLMRTYIAINEKKYKGRVKYLFQKKRSKTLAIVFSGFAENPVYNYVRTLKSLKADKLFILDDFAYRGSYYWYSNGSDEPLRLVDSLIRHVINGGGMIRYSLWVARRVEPVLFIMGLCLKQMMYMRQPVSITWVNT